MGRNCHFPRGEHFFFAARNHLAAVHEVDELAFRVDAEPVADLELILPAGG